MGHAVALSYTFILNKIAYFSKICCQRQDFRIPLLNGTIARPSSEVSASVVLLLQVIGKRQLPRFDGLRNGKGYKLALHRGGMAC
jgi:hypothetical protein